MVRRKCEALDCPEIMGPAAVSTGAENSKGFGYLVVDVLDLTIRVPAQALDCGDGSTIGDLSVAGFLRARRFNVAVSFRGLRRALSMPFNA